MPGVFDEPTQGIDVDAKEEVYRLLEELAADGAAVVFVSSEFSELARVCGRVVILSDGRVAGELEGAAVTARAIADACYAGAANARSG